MLYNIAFQDNIYFLLRQIDTLCDCLKLDIDDELFGDKLSDDIVFFYKAIDSLFERIYPQSSLQNFIDVLQSLHFCISRYLDLISFVLHKQSHCEISLDIKEITGIVTKHKEMLKKIEQVIEARNPAELENELVSQNELAFLLNT